MSDPAVTNVHLTPADDLAQTRGLVAFLKVTINGLVVDGIVLRRCREGKYSLSFPQRRDRHGQEHPIVTPENHRVRTSLTRHILAAIDRQLAEVQGGR